MYHHWHSSLILKSIFLCWPPSPKTLGKSANSIPGFSLGVLNTTKLLFIIVKKRWLEWRGIYEHYGNVKPIKNSTITRSSLLSGAWGSSNVSSMVTQPACDTIVSHKDQEHEVTAGNFCNLGDNLNSTNSDSFPGVQISAVDLDVKRITCFLSRPNSCLNIKSSNTSFISLPKPLQGS